MKMTTVQHETSIVQEDHDTKYIIVIVQLSKIKDVRNYIFSLQIDSYVSCSILMHHVRS